MKKDSARKRILDAASELIHRKGFNNTGLKEILEAARTPKGSFYFYFKSKEELGLALVDYHSERIAARARSCFDDESRPPLGRLRLFFEATHARHELEGCGKGCPIGNLCQEMSDLSPTFRRKLDSAMRDVISTVASLLRQAKDAGDLPVRLDPEETASFIMSSWQGALLTMKVERSTAPMRRFERFIFGELLADRK